MFHIYPTNCCLDCQLLLLAQSERVRAGDAMWCKSNTTFNTLCHFLCNLGTNGCFEKSVILTVLTLFLKLSRYCIMACRQECLPYPAQQRIHLPTSWYDSDTTLTIICFHCERSNELNSLIHPFIFFWLDKSPVNHRDSHTHLPTGWQGSQLAWCAGPLWLWVS